MEVRCGGACSHYFPYSPILFYSFYQLMTVDEITLRILWSVQSQPHPIVKQ